ncbi:tRNA (cytidine(34)-2'-O)-methyltransferase [bioreactor metagenome]|uniref:tRNA (Cytidine(34)-2'-O)-methyltransferase n=1 Tax=bioreactor metagenome TaxID=1076179 RepID=A0A645IUF8_9ZZZZ
MRTCAAAGTMLHLIKPYGFYLDEKHLKRSGMDYRKYVAVYEHDNWEAFTEAFPARYFFITRYGQQTYSDAVLKCDEDLYLVFGKESTGIPKSILQTDLQHCLRIPMIAEARSLNLANCVALVLYEALRQNDFLNLSKQEVIKGKDFILK